LWVALPACAVVVFMAFYYRGFGMIANLALFSNLVFIVVSPRRTKINLSQMDAFMNAAE
jgi:preprotein translocase subunit SecD